MGSKYKGSQQEIRALDAYIKLQRAVHSLKARIDRHQTVGDLGETQFGVMEALYHLGPLHQNEIGGKLLISKSNVVSVIDKLEQQGLVRRQRSSEDRRYIFVHLTDSGREIIGALIPGHAAAITTEMSCLSAAELDELGRLCRKLGLNQRD